MWNALSVLFGYHENGRTFAIVIKKQIWITPRQGQSGYTAAIMGKGH